MTASSRHLSLQTRLIRASGAAPESPTSSIVVNEIGLGYKSIVAALLHDVVEDTDYTVDDIKRLFGEKIASLVDGLTKIKAAMDTDGGGNLQAENFKRIILTLNDDVRVVLT